MKPLRTVPDLYLSRPHGCSYLPQREATMLVTDPHRPADTQLYGALVSHGFRRSGTLTYRPHCRDCRACVSVRIPAAEFQPSRAQRRTWERNQDVVVRERPAGFDEEYFALYRRYQSTRHPGGAMEQTDAEKFIGFLTSPHIETRFFEFRIGRALIAVAAVDRLHDGLSAVYTWYDTRLAARSPGTFAILWQVEAARRAGLPWVYLGYWIANCAKMEYKVNFRPLEGFRGGVWSRIKS